MDRWHVQRPCGSQHSHVATPAARCGTALAGRAVPDLHRPHLSGSF